MENSNSRVSKNSEWSLVLDHDWGPSSTISSMEPISVIQETNDEPSSCSLDTSVTQKDKSHAVIVLQAQQLNAQQNSGILISESVTRNFVSSDDCDEETTENIAAFISLSEPQQEYPENSLPGAVIHIQDPGLSSDGSDVKKIENEMKNVSKMCGSNVSDDISNVSSTKTNININNCNIDNCDTIKDFKWQYATYIDAIKELTEDLQLFAEGVAEPFSKVSVTLCKSSVYAGDLMRDGGLLDSLQQQGLASTLFVKDTGPNNWVLTGTLVELLALRTLAVRALKQAEECLGKTCRKSISTTEQTKYSEIGVMCQLLPSPKSERHTASLSHDESTKRSHSVVSQSLSPVTRRKKPRKHLLNTDNAKTKKMLFKILDEKIKSHNSLSSIEEFEKKISKDKKLEVLSSVSLDNFLQKVSSQEQKINPMTKDNKNVTNLINKETSVLADLPIVEVILGELKSEPDCDDTVISETVVSDSNLVSNFVNITPNCLESDTLINKIGEASALKVDKFDDQVEEKLREMDEICEKVRQMDEICFPETSNHNIFTEVASNKENIQNLNLLESDINESKTGQHEPILKEVDEVSDNDNICQLEMSISDDINEFDSKNIKVFQGSGQTNDTKFKFSCKICSFKSTRENHYIKHMKLHDKGLALYKCTECSFVSIRASHLRRHKMTHAQQVLSCNLCAYTCDDQKLLTKHIRVKHVSNSKHLKSDLNEDASVAPPSTVYECSECNYKTSWQYAFQRHSRTHHTSKLDIIHTCPDCPYKTIRREHFLRHIKNVHQNYRPYLCDVCGKAFKRQDALKQHHVTHYPHFGDGSSNTYGYVCHICQKVCRSTGYLKEHMATHSEERSFLCEICGACFKTRSVQRNHVQTIHRKPRAFTCLQCDKKFNTKFALRRHMKQHETTAEDNSERNQLEVTHTTSRMRDVQQIAMEKPNKTITPNAHRSASATKVFSHKSSIAPSMSSSTPSSIPSSTLSSGYSRSAVQAKASCKVLSPSSIVTKANQQRYQHSQISNSRGSSPAYQITIDGQPAYLLPIKEGGTSTGHQSVAAVATGDTGGIVVHGGSSQTVNVHCDGVVTSERQINLPAADNVTTHSQLIPIMPHTTTVHIVNSQTEPGVTTSTTSTSDSVLHASMMKNHNNVSVSSSALVNAAATTTETVILGPNHYDTHRNATMTADETATYVTQHSNNTTILYLTNFT